MAISFGFVLFSFYCVTACEKTRSTNTLLIGVVRHDDAYDIIVDLISSVHLLSANFDRCGTSSFIIREYVKINCCDTFKLIFQ